MKEINGELTTEKLVRTLAHELRNSLSAISNTAYLVRLELSKAQGVNPKTAERVSIIEKESKYINDVLTALVSFYKNEPQDRCACCLNKLVEDTLAGLPVPPGVSVELKLNEAPQVQLNREEMMKAVKCIIENSLQSMPGGGALLVTTGLESTGSALCPADVLDKAFEPFFSTKTKGIGLGLPLAKRIIEETYRGALTLVSEPGKGTAVTVRLPL